MQAVLTVRPKFAELTFQLFGRSLHPELFVVHKSREFSRAGYSAKVDIINAGHLITWHYQGITLAEIFTSKHHPLPQQRCYLQHDLKGKGVDQYSCPSGIHYDCSYQLELARPELFWTFQKELAKSEHHEGLLYTFDSSGRLAIGAMSYVYVETREKSMRVQAFHTFPDDGAIVKSETVFKIE